MVRIAKNKEYLYNQNTSEEKEKEEQRACQDNCVNSFNIYILKISHTNLDKLNLFY